MVEIYFDDLTPEAQERVLKEGFHGDLGNYDLFPIAYVGEEDAVGYVQDNLDELELPDVEEYLEDSFEVGDYAYLLEK